jgi:hypothetical protein
MAVRKPAARVKRYSPVPLRQTAPNPVRNITPVKTPRVPYWQTASGRAAAGRAGAALAQAYQKANPGVALPGQAGASDPDTNGLSVEDPTFLAWQAQRENQINQTRAGYDATDRAEALARQEALRRLGTQRPTQVRQTNESFNRAGLFYSGQLGRAQDENTANFTQQTGDINARYDASAEARRAARAALDQGYPLEVAAQMAAAADRKITADTAAADQGVLAPVAPATTVTSIAKAKVKAPPKVVKKTPQKVTRKPQQALARKRAKKKFNLSG